MSLYFIEKKETLFRTLKFVKANLTSDGSFPRSHRPARIQALICAAMPFCFGLLIVAMSMFCAVCPATAAEPLGVNDFTPAVAQGFGDRDNSVMWSMKWWDKTQKLYVGTNRAWLCWSYAGVVATYPIISYLYPPRDPDVVCAADYNDLPLQAEIWSWDPQTDIWERVYQSPQDVPIPDSDKFVARDIAFRSMVTFTESDGTEAMYITGTTSKPIHKDVPPPRILRTTDGINLEPIPQDAGTFMGELPKASFRSLTPYKDRLFVIHGSVQGNGKILESANPAAGNDAWRQVSPDEPELRVFEMYVFNDFLYVGAVDLEGGYAVLKTDAEGEPPYQFTTVVAKGAYLANPSRAVVSMHEFNGSMYVGTDGPSEMIRIHPDDTWDLIIGTPRQTPEGAKFPLGEMDEGFNFALNEHIWRMQADDGNLYVGTYDAATTQRTCPGKDYVLHDRMGFDLYRSSDGIHFSAITLNGFGDPFDFGVRTLQSTPYGLFLGTANYYYGANLYRAIPSQPKQLLDPPGYVQSAYNHPDGVTIYWEPSPNATSYEVYRAGFATIYMNIPGGIFPPGLDPFEGCARDVPLDPLPEELQALILDSKLQNELGLSTVSEQFVFDSNQAQGQGQQAPLSGELIATTEATFFLDSTIEPWQKYSYYVIAKDPDGNRSSSSNLVSFPRFSLPLLGDMDWDNDVDMADRTILFQALRSCVGDTGFRAEADLDQDHCITFNDYRIWYNLFLLQQ